MGDIDNKVVLGAVGLFAATYGWLLRHLFGKAQFKDVCESERRRLDDCIEAEMKRNSERYTALEKKIDRLTDIVLNGGNPRGRVRT